MRLGIKSDTHNVLRQEVMDQLSTCDFILHAGDFCKEEILNQLQAAQKVYAVRGNNDKGQWAEDLPKQLVLNLQGFIIGMAHEKKDLPQGDIDLMVYGHSHQYADYQEEGRWYINPGSCGRKRFNLTLSFAIVEVIDKVVEIYKIDL